ncbi:hypothetical protein LB456_09085 [Psychroflexus sp. CAK57W]|uniref:hypothetical protein n=1 Tax=Psychroflexus curvus TaxID=2873595 RepID=UPI001CCB9B8E|nr:hypothetical protein [Psychroflexus curvus]MBZ9787608.1 hypothetical protein [Psychroflexus curvus]
MESEKIRKGSIGRKFNRKVFIEENASFNSFMKKINETIFKPLERQCLKPDIFWYIVEEEDYFSKCDTHQYHLDIIKREFFLYHLDLDFDMTGKIRFFDKNLLKDVKYQLDRYLIFRENIFFSSHRFSRMLLCFDDFFKNFIYKSNFENNLCKKLHKPMSVYQSYWSTDSDSAVEIFNVKTFYSHVLPRVEIEKRINSLTNIFTDRYKYNEYLKNGNDKAQASSKVELITGVFELEEELNSYLIEQIDKNRFFYKGIDFTYFIDDLLDLLDVLKSKLLSRKQKRYVNDFSTKLVSLIESNKIKNLKKEKVEFKDFFKKLDSKKINIIESKFSKLTNKDLAMFISLAYNDFGILDIRLNDKNGYSSSDFIRLFEENKNIQSVNKHIDSNLKFTGLPADLEPIENQLHSILK